ncbi:MAG: hypothetical protein IT258_02470 [Saprospiraceae bacterium]|nr:hypothetical protein [Saprospiraceae bacterium]
MKEEFFWPPRNSEFTKWLANFIKFVTSYASVIRLKQDDIDWLNSIYKAVAYAEDAAVGYKKAWLDFVATRNTIIDGDAQNAALAEVPWPKLKDLGEVPAMVAPNAMTRISGYVQTVANCLSLTRDQLKEAGVTSRPRTKPNPAQGKPSIKVTVVNGQAVINCPLNGFKGYAVFAKDNDGEVTRIGNSTARKYVDARPLPANVNTQQRTYFVQYIWNENELVGEFSNSVTVAVMRYV